MAKQVIHVGLAVATDGFYPGKANIVSIAASLGQVGNFSVNIRPKNGVYGDSPFWEKHLNEWVELKKDPVQLDDAMTRFRQWLHQWQGNLIACTSSKDFWHIFVAMLETGKDCPFGSDPLDTNSYYAGMEGRKTPIRIMAAVRPIEVAHQRWEMVTKGVIPQFGPEKKTPKLKLRLSSDSPYPPPPSGPRNWRTDMGMTNHPDAVPTSARPVDPARPVTNRRFTPDEVRNAINAQSELLRQHQQTAARLTQQQQAAMQQGLQAQAYQPLTLDPQSFDEFRRRTMNVRVDSDEAWQLDPPENE